ncbi:MAG: DMT family transporter [Rhodobacterales bacterium]|jgi:drug/metabolite transporter (DMT)-like permease|nr:DMT family transporter [Rhodobacterales bacterium]
MELWIPVTLVAAFSQNVRNALQKTLKGRLSTWGATASRFVFAAPLAVLFCLVLLQATGESAGQPPHVFYLWGMAGGLAQIVATGLLIHLFSYTNFAVATAFTKTEPLQTALFGIVLLGDRLTAGAAIGIVISLVGVILVSMPQDEGTRRWKLDRKVWIGVLSGGLFGLSAVAYRGASLSLAEGSVLVRASVTLAFVTVFQALAILGWLAWRERGEVTRLLQAWRVASLVGISGMFGSLCWFTAFTLENAAHVRAVGQVEVIITLAISILFFREKVTLREIAGVLLVAAGVVALVLLAH